MSLGACVEVGKDQAAFDASSGVLYCVGAQKSGTSWLFRQVRKHPSIHALQKEVHYWDRRRAPYISWETLGLPDAKIKSGEALSPYEAMFDSKPSDHSRYKQYLSRGASAGSWLVDFSPSYSLCAADTFADMQAVHEKTRFALFLRDPVARLWSGIRHKYQRLHRRDLANAEDLYDAFSRSIRDKYDPDFRRSRYDEIYRALRVSVPEEDILIMTYEDVPKNGLCRLLDFIELPQIKISSPEPANVGVAGDISLDRRVVAAAYEELKEVYEWVDAMFGMRPDSWLTDDKLATAGPRMKI